MYIAPVHQVPFEYMYCQNTILNHFLNVTTAGGFCAKTAFYETFKLHVISYFYGFGGIF
jgi:hypothetical protein